MRYSSHAASGLPASPIFISPLNQSKSSFAGNLMMQFRKAIPTDAQAIAEVNVLSWQAAYAEILPAAFLQSLSGEDRVPFWEKSLSTKDTTNFVAESPAGIGAFISFGTCRHGEISAPEAEIWALYALPELWGKGVGRELMHLARQHLQAAGFAGVSLWVLARNQRARGFYEAAGFVGRVGAARHRDIGGSRIEEIRYTQVFGPHPDRS